MISDLRFAFRQLVKSPGFAFVAVLTLAVGIGANTAIFSVINSALLRPLRYPEPEQLVEIWSVLPSGFHFATISGPQVKQLREHATKFSAMAIYHPLDVNLIDQGKSERVSGLEVSANFLSTLRRDPLLGRTFDRQEDQVGGENNVMMLTHEWWQTRFGGDPKVIGQVVNLGGISRTVVGVLPPSALVQDNAKFLVPLVLEGEDWRMNADSPWANTIFRLQPGATVAEAQEEARALCAELHRRILPDRSEVRLLQVLPLQQLLTETSRPTFLMLLGAVALVLLIACANVANLLLARANRRQKEMAIRTAMGATGGQIIRQVLTESLLLAFLGGLAGMTFAVWGVDLLGRAVLDVLPEMMQPKIDLGVLLFSFGLVCGTGVLFGLFPALRARNIDLNRDLKEDGRGSTSGSRTRAQSTLIVMEVALTAMLLIGAGLLLRSFARILNADLGFNPHNVLACDVSITERSFKSDDEVTQYHRDLMAGLKALPGVQAVGTSTTLPLSGETWGGRISLSREGYTRLRGGGGGIDFVGGDYFQAMGITLLKGRHFSEADNTPDGPRVAVIDEPLAKSLFLNENPIGQQVRFDEQDWEVIGVVRGIRHRKIDEPAKNRLYLPHARSPWSLRLILRTTVEPLSLAEEVRTALTAINSNQSVSNFRTLEQLMGRSLKERRVALALVGTFAAIAIGLACLGIYGVMAYTIGQRQRELAIRMALGAQRQDVIRLVVRDGSRLGAAGIGVGLVGGLIGARLIASRLYEVSANDPVVFGAVIVIIAGVVALGMFLPARRAANLSAIEALRSD